MRATSIVLLFALVASAFAAPLLHADSPKAIPGRYIVVFNTGLTSERRNAHYNMLNARVQSRNDTLLAKYEIENFMAYSALLTQETLTDVMKDTSIQYVEADQTVSIKDTESNPTWGLDRIDQVKLPLDKKYHYSTNAGAGVNAYIIDTGIYVKHTEFTGRITWGANFADDTDDDCQGHGTHVAGTVGGTIYGVAKKVTLFAVKVLDCDGSGTNSGVISGIQWAANHRKTANKPGVGNMSLGGGASASLDAAVNAAIKSGLTLAVAAGNEDSDACGTSPARVPSAVTVGATTNKDARASFSNYGTCVDLFAPGQAITSAWIGGTKATNTISGTSMATPHVAGAIAVHLGANADATPADVSSWLLKVASADQVTDPVGSPNLLLYSPY